MAQRFGGIKFRDNYKSLPEFKKELENTSYFKAIPHLERDAELEKAYKYATRGNVPTSTKSSSKANTSKSK